MQAASRGVVDFSKARPYDPLWRRHLRLLLDGLENQIKLEYVDLLHRHYAAILTISNPSEETFANAKERMGELSFEYYNLLYPDRAQSKEEAEKQQVRGNIDRWQQRFGNLNSPEVQARIARTAEALDRLGRESVQAAQRGIEDLMGSKLRRAARTLLNAREQSRKGR